MATITNKQGLFNAVTGFVAKMLPKLDDSNEEVLIESVTFYTNCLSSALNDVLDEGVNIRLRENDDLDAEEVRHCLILMMLPELVGSIMSTMQTQKAAELQVRSKRVVDDMLKGMRGGD